MVWEFTKCDGHCMPGLPGTAATRLTIVHQVQYNKTGACGVQVGMEDFESALAEIKPAFGAVTETLAAYCLNGMIDFGAPFRHLLATCQTLVEQVGPFERSAHPKEPFQGNRWRGHRDAGGVLPQRLDSGRPSATCWPPARRWSSRLALMAGSKKTTNPRGSN